MKSTESRTHLSLKLIAIIAIVFMLYVLKPVLVPLLFAIVLSVMIYPLVAFFEKKWRFGRVLSSFTAVIVLTIVTTGVLLFIWFQVRGFLNKGDLYYAKLHALYSTVLNYIETTLVYQKVS